MGKYGESSEFAQEGVEKQGTGLTPEGLGAILIKKTV